MEETKKKNQNGIEQFILSLNDPVLSHMLYSPEFRNFISREQTGIRMLTRQTLLGMFSSFSNTPVHQHSVPINLPARPEPAKVPVQAPARTEKQPRETEEELYDLSKFRQNLEQDIPVPEEMDAINNRMVSSEPAHDESAGTLEEDPRKVLLDIIKGKTGYTEEMIDPDAEFESELRIDSIKQTEIIGMFSEKTGIPMELSRQIELEKVTLNTILDKVTQLMQENG